MAQRSTSPAAGKRGVFARVVSQIERRTLSSPKHHPAVESLTVSVQQDLTVLRSALGRLVQHAQALAQHDPTHGRRVFEAARTLADQCGPIEQRVAEMRQHLDEDTP
jgi:hypothetical protein